MNTRGYDFQPTQDKGRGSRWTTCPSAILPGDSGNCEEAGRDVAPNMLGGVAKTQPDQQQRAGGCEI